MIQNKDETILKTFVLPLYGISVKSVEDVYINAYLNKEGNFLFLKVKEFKDCLANNLLYSGIFEYKNEKYNLFSTSKVYENDIQLIMSGKYSQISQQAKNTIIQLCGLGYMVREKNGSISCASELLALTKHPALRKKLEMTLATEGLPKQLYNGSISESSELFSKLTEEAFIDNIIIKES